MKYFKCVFFLLIFCSSSALVKSQESQFIEQSGNTIHYKVFGEGNPVLIINGGPGMNSNGFAGLASIIGKKYKAIIYDQRGTGESTLDQMNSSTITMNLMVEDIEMIRKELDIKEWVVLGHSFGGILASYYTSKHSSKISGLILSSSAGLNMDLFSSLNITARLTSLERDSLNYWNRKIQSGDTSYHARLQQGKYLAPAYLNDKSFASEVAQRLTQGNSRINSLVYQDLRNIGYDVIGELKDYKNPVLIMQGEHDIIPLTISEKAHSIFKDSRLIILPNSSHYGWLEDSLIYFSEIDSLIKKATTNK